MGKTIKIFLLLWLAYSVQAQAPEMLNYQAVARNNAGVALANQTIKVRLTLLRNSISLYSETRQVTTNLLGLFNVQIGSAGALVTSGSMQDINWLANTPNIIMLKVELDLNNTNVFTDMGTQPFSTVLFSFGANKAIEVVNLAGRYIDPVTMPVSGSRLVWNGYSWSPIRRDSVIYNSGSIPTIAAGGPNAPWEWLGYTNGATPLPVITMSGNEVISAHWVAGLGHSSGNFIPIATSVCYQNTSGGNITSFDGINTGGIEAAIPVNTTAPITSFSATGSKKLASGTYRIGMCIKNKSGTGASINNSFNFHNGVIEIKY
ncbi:MAG: hypothetical protein IPN29_20495 [Saprospiraceae bacterium]|nr:hypothetical protein [Saprospiraceae bacterium]